MVEVKIVLAPAHHARTFVSLPNFYFYGCRNQPIVREFLRLPGFRANRIRARDELKFENLPMATAFFKTAGVNRFPTLRFNSLKHCSLESDLATVLP